MAGILLLPLLQGCSLKEAKTIVINSDDDLAGLTVSCSNGNYYERKYSAREDVKVFATNSETDAIQAVRQGLADVFVSDEVMLSQADMERLGMKMALRGEESFDVAFALRKGNRDLQQKLNDFISTAPVGKIIDHWINGGPDVAEAAGADPGAAPLRIIACVNMEPVSYIGDGGKWLGMDIDIRTSAPPS